MFCSKCGAQVAPGVAFCANCGAPMMPVGGGGAAGPSRGATGAAGEVAGAGAAARIGAGVLGAKYSYLPPYWQFVFQKFDQQPGRMQTHWNWPAFFFGAFWYLVKGMPAKAALYFVISLVTYGAAWLFLAIYAGLYGSWDYYLKEVQGKQLW